MLSNIIGEKDCFEIMNETFEHSLIPLFWCDDNSFTIVNHSFIKLTGYTQNELLSKTFDDITLEANAHDSLNKIFPFNKRETKVFTWVIQKEDATPISVELRLTQFYIDHTKRYYFGMVRRFLEEVEPESNVFIEEHKRLQIALEASKQGLWEWNVPENETKYSKEYYEMLGYNNQAFVANYEVWLDMLHPYDIDTAVARWEDFENSDKETYRDEFRLKRKDGEYLWVCSEGKKIDNDKQGKPIRIVGIVRDINDRKLDEQKIQTQTQRLIDYAFFNSHRLRAPLSSILGLTNLLKHEYSPEIVKSLEKVSTQLDDVVHELNQILVGDTEEFKISYHAPVKKISLIDKDKIMHVAYKKSIERYSEDVEINSFDRAKQVLELVNNKTLSTDLVLLDIDSAFDIWGFLDEYDKTYTQTPIYLLAKNIPFNYTIKASQYNCVKGILLKPLDRKAIEGFMQQLSN